MDLENAIRLNEQESLKGKDASFSNWWFFDTNCISELIKLTQNGYESKVHVFLNDKDILILSSVVEELRKRPDLLDKFDKTFSTANPYLVSDNTRFWYTDIFNFFE